MALYKDFKTGRMVEAKDKREARFLLNVSARYAMAYLGVELVDEYG